MASSESAGPPYKRVLTIVNPVSGQHDAGRIRELVERELTKRDIEVEVRFTEGEGDALRWAQGAADEGFDLVIASGGDGTVMEAMSGLVKCGCPVPLAQLPAGTASLLARALDVPQNLEKALEVALTGEAVRLDVGYLPTHDRYFALVAGAGWDARLIEDAPRGLKRRIGFAAYIFTGLKNLTNLRRTTIELEIDGKKETRTAHTVMIANIGQIDSVGLALGPDIGPHDGKLDAVIVASSTARSVARLTYRLLTRQFSNYRDLAYIKAERVSVKTSTPLPLEIDGEPIGETPFVAEIVPEGALVIVPQVYVERVFKDRPASSQNA